MQVSAFMRVRMNVCMAHYTSVNSVVVSLCLVHVAPCDTLAPCGSDKHFKWVAIINTLKLKAITLYRGMARGCTQLGGAGSKCSLCQGQAFA